MNSKNDERNPSDEETEEDRISSLPDSIIHDILSLLPSTREAVRTGTLSKRWKYLWTSLQTLIFVREYDFMPSESVSGVDKTLVHRGHAKLKKLIVDIDHGSYFEYEIKQLIGYAVGCDVEELSLHLSEFLYTFDLPSHLYSNGCVISLSLQGCCFGRLRMVDWRNLKCLYVKETYLSEDWIDSILQGTPALETMELCFCYSFGGLKFTSTGMEKLVIDGYNGYDENLEIIAPNLLSLNITSVLYLKKVVLRDVSSLVEANFDYKVGPTNYTDKKVENEEMEEDMLKGFIENLKHVKELKIGVNCYEVLSRLKAKGLAFPPNMKFPIDSPFHAHADSLDGGGSGELNIRW